MAAVDRRQMLTAIGSSSVLAYCAGRRSLAEAVDSGSALEGRKPAGEREDPWRYRPLDPEACADRAYAIYPEGGCMYAVVGSVLGELSARYGAPYDAFPVVMMRYGDGGVGAWGSLCGVVNGGAALCGLFHPEQDKATLEQLVTELCTWYETSALPQYAPTRPEWASETMPCVAGSLLCHVSVGRWCKVAERDAFSIEKKERCRRLASDGAKKVVEILNRKASGDGGHAALAPAVTNCLECHGPEGTRDAMGKMSCTTCHQMPETHP
ncbi:MAG: C_GCAxxG_C_C family protein [Pirellulales bacterium]|nr:C_GCAxxG_C_C family protein [Pirellulales bacterium]